MSSTNGEMENIAPPGGVLDLTLRPVTWVEYIGQESVKRTLRILIDAAKKRQEPIEHTLFYGPPGLGKTTLAYLIAREMETQIRITSGPAIERVGDLAALLTNLSPGDILFIDEVHRMNKLVEEVLYPAMESRTIDIIIGKGPSARTIQLDLPPFTLLAATTRAGLLSSPLRSRFSGGTYRLDFYTVPEIIKILRRSASILNTHVDEDALEIIARRSRFTPRIANQLLKRCRDVASMTSDGKVHTKVAAHALQLLDIDERGLGGEDRKLLETLIHKFHGGPVGLTTLAAAISEDVNTIEEVYEPYLLQLGFIERTSRGRVATEHAFHHLGVKRPELQSPLLS